MIVVTITIEEEEKQVSSNGIVTGIAPTPREDRMAREMMKAIESYCMSRRIEGSRFLRHDLPTDGESLQSD